jgi:hypothetical protein
MPRGAALARFGSSQGSGGATRADLVQIVHDRQASIWY